MSHLNFVQITEFARLPWKNASNRPYPQNANSNTCAPNTLKFHTFCGLCVTKQCFKFELDILNGSGVIPT